MHKWVNVTNFSYNDYGHPNQNMISFIVRHTITLRKKKFNGKHENIFNVIPEVIGWLENLNFSL